MGRIGYHTASSAVIAYQLGLDVTANNIANVNTNGFKASRADFADLIYTERNNRNEETQYGHGVKVDKTNMLYEQGILKHTERKLDFAALDDGFFGVRTLGGDMMYTKDGAFYINVTDNTLRDSNGSYVLDYNGNDITVPYTDGLPDYEAIRDAVGIFTFENPYGLDQQGRNYLEATESSGEAAAAPQIKKKQGYLEASSTNIANEMTQVIEYQRAFQLNTKMIQLHNELEEKINSLR